MNTNVIRNTLFLYARTAITMVIALYMSRIVLNELGISDYGIYSVIGGVVAMFQTLSATLSGASQRFITYALGAKDPVYLQQTFSASVKTHTLLALSILLLSETIGVWFTNVHLNIPPERIFAANIVFQCTLLSLVLDIISIPFSSTIIAYERFRTFATIYILHAFVRLSGVFLLQIVDTDKLIFYAISEVLSSLFIRSFFIIYCKKKFVCCKVTRDSNNTIIKSIVKFCGWNFLGTSSTIIYNQTGNIFINMLYGVTLNAAIGVTTQVQNAVNNFVNNFTVALNPHITKSYATGDYTNTIKNIFIGSKVSIYLLTLVAIPLITMAKYILNLWLGTVPEYTYLFVKLSLVLAVANSFFPTIICGLFATGNIKKYQIIISVINIIKILILYIGLKFNFSPAILYIIPFIMTFYNAWIIIKDLNKDFSFPIRNFFNEVIIRGLLIFFALTFAYKFIPFFSQNQEISFISFLLKVILITIINLAVIFLIGITKKERLSLILIVKQRLSKQ